MSQPEDIVLPDRRAYRRRRITDAARLLPVLGCFLFILPVFVAGGDADATTASGLVFVFSIWGMLIVASAFLSRRLGRDDGDDEGNGHG